MNIAVSLRNIICKNQWVNKKKAKEILHTKLIDCYIKKSELSLSHSGPLFVARTAKSVSRSRMRQASRLPAAPRCAWDQCSRYFRPARVIHRTFCLCSQLLSPFNVHLSPPADTQKHYYLQQNTAWPSAVALSTFVNSQLTIL